MPLNRLSQSDLQRLKSELELIPKESIDIDENFEMVEIDISPDLYQLLVDLSDSNDEVDMSYTINRLLISYLESNDADLDYRP